MSTYLELPKGRLHFHKMGKGPSLMLALHGFAQSGEHFTFLEEHLTDQFTIYAIDLPFHGLTEWKISSFDPQDVLTWVQSILKKEAQEKCYLLGHSLGGRIWLSCLEMLLPITAGVILLAPDGLATKGMFLPEAIPSWGRKELAKTVKKPTWLLKLAFWMHRYHLLSAFAHKYLQYHFRSDSRQQRLLNTWIALGNFNVKLSHIRKKIESQKKMKLIILLGKNDPLMASRRFQKIAEAIPQMDLVIVPGGHQLNNNKVALEVKERLRQINDSTNQQINK